MNAENEDPKQPAEAENSDNTEEPQATRELVVPAAEASDSPGVQDRDTIIPVTSSEEPEEPEVVRDLIIPPAQNEPEDEATDS